MKDLDKLQKVWYAKLKETGFDDIEYSNGGLRKAYQANANSSVKNQIGRQEYYAKAAEFAEHYIFKSERNKEIWILYSEGLSLSEIGKKMNLSKPRIDQIIKEIKPVFEFYIWLECGRN